MTFNFSFRKCPQKFIISAPIRWSSYSYQMNLTPNIPSTCISIPFPLKFSTCSCFLPTTPKPLRTTSFQISNSQNIPARDRVIDLGKYRGKMLGSLPSNYLKWVSKNLRAGDTEEWAKLADEVLRDPVYRDRMEWELAEKILNGNAASPSCSGNGGNAVSELLEISQRFGWDNEDKEGWSKIDFGLLGTSKGGRIPRVGAGRKCGSVKKKEKIKVEEEMMEGGRRRERRERMRQRRVETSGGGRVERRTEERNMNGEGKGEEREDGDGGRGEVVNVGNWSPFPGREALLRKVVDGQRF